MMFLGLSMVQVFPLKKLKWLMTPTYIPLYECLILQILGVLSETLESA